MSIFKSFKEGIKQVNSNKKMLLTLYIFNLIFALIITAPLYSFLSSILSKSLLAEDLTKKFNIKFLVELIPQHIDALRPFKGLILFSVCAFFLLSIFLAGGIIYRFQHQEENRFLSKFFQGCGAYFLRFIRLMLISLICYSLVVIISLLIGLATGAFLPSPAFSFILPGIILLFLILLINMLFDYAKIKTVVEDKGRMFLTTLESFKFIFRHLGGTLGLYYLIFLLSLVLVFILIFIKNFITPSNWGLIVLLFIWQQIIIIAKLLIRMLFFSSQLQLYKRMVK